MKRIKQHLKRPLAMITALIMVLTTIPFSSIPAHAEGGEPVTDINLIFDSSNFTKFQIGQVEGDASKQFRNQLVSVAPEDYDKYYFDKSKSNSYMCYASDEYGTGFAGGDNSPQLISGDKEYYLCYTINPWGGHVFSENPEEMNFYINGERVTPYKTQVVGYGSWRFWVPAGTPAPRPPVVYLENIVIDDVKAPKVGEKAISIPSTNDNESYYVGNYIWTSPDDETFAADNTFKEDKTYKVQLSLAPNYGYEFLADSEDPTVFAGTAKIKTGKKNGVNDVYEDMSTVIDEYGNLSLSYTFDKTPVIVNDIYLNFDKANFTAFQVGKIEKDADEQFRNEVVSVSEENYDKYYFDNVKPNSGLDFLSDQYGTTFDGTGNSTNPISADKEYYLCYTVNSRHGYAFSENLEEMNFYINGEKVTPYKAQVVGDGDWRFWVPDTPMPKYIVKPQENVNAEMYDFNNVYLTWDSQSVEGVTVKYKVEYKKSTESDYVEFPDVLTGNKLYITNLDGESEYVFRVTPYVEEDGEVYKGEAGYSQDIRTLKKLNALNVKVKLYGHDDIHVSWDAQVIEGATVKYKVEYRRSTWSDYKVLNYGITKNYRKKANLVNGARYKFKVTPYIEKDGVKHEGSAEYSSYIYTLKKITAPRVSKSSRNYVRLRWTNIPGESGYQIVRSRYKTKGFTTVKRVSYKYSTTTAKTVRNRTYYYKIRAYKTVDGKRIYAPWSAVRAYRLR